MRSCASSVGSLFQSNVGRAGVLLRRTIRPRKNLIAGLPSCRRLDKHCRDRARGKARQGKARQGKARQGKARHGMGGTGPLGLVPHFSLTSRSDIFPPRQTGICGRRWTPAQSRRHAPGRALPPCLLGGGRGRAKSQSRRKSYKIRPSCPSEDYSLLGLFHRGRIAHRVGDVRAAPPTLGQTKAPVPLYGRGGRLNYSDARHVN
jgi:hypothetical protein